MSRNAHVTLARFCGPLPTTRIFSRALIAEPSTDVCKTRHSGGQRWARLWIWQKPKNRKEERQDQPNLRAVATKLCVDRQGGQNGFDDYAYAIWRPADRRGRHRGLFLLAAITETFRIDWRQPICRKIPSPVKCSPRDLSQDVEYQQRAIGTQFA
jgi:hypothetical protein